MPRRCAWRMTFSQSAVRVFFGAMMSRTRSTRISAPPPGIESRPASRRRVRVAGTLELRAARDVLDLRRRERVQVDRVALLDRAEEVLVVVDGEVGVVPALHEDAGAADRECLLDLLEDDRLRQQVALGAVAGPAVEGAEVAVGDADVRVVDVAIDDERDPAGVGAPGPERLGGPADRDEVLRLEERQRLGVGDPLAVEGLLENCADAVLHAGTTSPSTKRRSGMRSSSPASRASSMNVKSPARSRGPNR